MIKIPRNLLNKMANVRAQVTRTASSFRSFFDKPLNFLDGVRVAPSEPTHDFTVFEPATGKEMCRCPSSGAKDVDDAVKSAREAFKSWSLLTGLERGRIMLNASAKLRERKEEFAQMEVYDQGKPIWEARLDVDTVIDAFDFFGGLAANIKGEHMSLAGGSFGIVRREPLGVCAGVGPWNYPIQMAGWKAAPALACGNTMVNKPSPFTPITTVMLAELFIGEHLPLAGGSFGIVRREPLGVCVGIGAWNFPFSMAAGKSAPALACGNTMVYKPSPFTPITTVMLAELFIASPIVRTGREVNFSFGVNKDIKFAVEGVRDAMQRGLDAGFPKGAFNVVQGEGETGRLLASHPGVNKVSFTGSVPTGKKVMATCAEGVKHVTLELGGKSPLIIFADADMENAVKGAMNGNFFTQGEVCSNCTRVFVESSIAEEFVQRLVAKTKSMKVGDPRKEDTMMGAMITKEHREKVLGYIESARKEGAKVMCGGEVFTPEDPELRDGYYMTPCVIDQVGDHMTVAKEEIFGPVLSVLTFQSEEEAVTRANNTNFGLGAGLFTSDLKVAHRVAAQLESGFVWINNYNILPAGLPFGGYKHSGFGRENAAETINNYTQTKTVLVEMGDVECPY